MSFGISDFSELSFSSFVVFQFLLVGFLSVVLFFAIFIEFLCKKVMKNKQQRLTPEQRKKWF